MLNIYYIFKKFFQIFASDQLATFFVLSVFPCPSESQNDDKLILSET